MVFIHIQASSYLIQEKSDTGTRNVNPENLDVPSASRQMLSYDDDQDAKARSQLFSQDARSQPLSQDARSQLVSQDARSQDARSQDARSQPLSQDAKARSQDNQDAKTRSQLLSQDANLD